MANNAEFICFLEQRVKMLWSPFQDQRRLGACARTSQIMITERADLIFFEYCMVFMWIYGGYIYEQQKLKK